MPQGRLGTLMLLGAVIGFLAGYIAFEPWVKKASARTFPLVLRFSSEAELHAKGSFALGCAVMLAALPLAAAIGCRFDRKAPFWSLLFRSALVAAMCFGLAAVYHRQEMLALKNAPRDLWKLFRDSDGFVLWNPLSRTALIGAAGALFYGLLQATLFHVSKKR